MPIGYGNNFSSNKKKNGEEIKPFNVSRKKTKCPSNCFQIISQSVRENIVIS
jgi:hypothetical protein